MNVLITGASSGFGEAMARKFAENGCQVIGAARRTERLVQLAGELSSSFLPLEMDVTSRASIEAALESVSKRGWSIDILINNAGLALGMEPAHQASLDDWETMIDTNCKGLMAVTRLVLPGMVAHGGGTIINISSIAGTYPYPGGNVYGATKAFVDQFTLNLRADLLGTGVRAASIAPGLASGTEFSNVRFRGDAIAANRVYEGATPLRPEDIAEAAYWIATLPAHININYLEMMPTCQAFAPLAVKRN